MKRLLLINMLLIGFLSQGMSQEMSIEELKALKADKIAMINGLKSEVNDIEAKIFEFPGWKLGGVGTVGFGINSNNNWYALSTPNSQSTTYGVGFNGYANLDEEKFFWRNLLNISAANIATEIDKNSSVGSVVSHLSGIDLSSLFGYKLNKNWAVSVEGKWLSSLLNYAQGGSPKYSLAINDPGQLTISAGMTWTPLDNFVVLIHPLGYQKNWPGSLFSSPGAKIGATYAGQILPGISWASNLSAFLPYSSTDNVEFEIEDIATPISVEYGNIGNFVNYIWTNTFSTNLWKGLGLSFEIGLRGDKQVWDLGSLKAMEVPTAAGLKANNLQSYTNFGISYTF